MKAEKAKLALKELADYAYTCSDAATKTGKLQKLGPDLILFLRDEIMRALENNE